MSDTKRIKGLSRLSVAGLGLALGLGVLSPALLVAPTAAFASGSSCYHGSCQYVNGSDTFVAYTTTNASSCHGGYLDESTWDTYGYLDYTAPEVYTSGCSEYPVTVDWEFDVNVNENDYGQSFYSGGWQGIATVKIFT